MNHMLNSNYTSNQTPYSTLKKESEEDPLKNISFQPKVVIEDLVYEKVMHFVQQTDFEVSGLGKVIHDKKNNIFRVVNAFLVEQENTPATTELSGAGIAKLMYEQRETEDNPGSLRWWWHSHVSMNVFWSGTDMATMKQLGMHGWFVATVFNQHEEKLSAIIQGEPLRMFMSDIETTIRRELPEELMDQWDAEFEENVTEKRYSFKHNNTKVSRPVWEQKTRRIDDAISVIEDDEEEVICEICDEIIDFCWDANCELTHCPDCETHTNEDEEELLKRRTLAGQINTPHNIDYSEFDTATRDAMRDIENEEKAMDQVPYGFHIVEGVGNE